MLLYHCTLTFHDNLFYETRTLGRLYETGRILHNIALCYALGFASTGYFHRDDVPQYEQELAPVNNAGVYVTPAQGLDVRYVVHTFKLGDERSAVMMERSNVNIPSYGRAKEIGIGSRFAFGVLSEQPLPFPRWIRMGLWLSKARLTANEADPIQLNLIEARNERERARTVSIYPLNPTDLPDTAALRLFDLVSMRPSSLVENALIESDQWWHGTLPDGRDVYLPVGLQHRAAVGSR
jgi:CRISPR-associated protein Csc1